MSRTRALAALLPALLLSGSPARAQIPLPWLSGYYLTVPLWSDAGPFSEGGFGNSQRLRLMADHRLGPVAFDAAYEHFISWSATAGGGLGIGVPGAVAPGGGEWLNHKDLKLFFYFFYNFPVLLMLFLPNHTILRING